MKALLHGGPLDDTWWELPDGEGLPKVLLPQDGLGADAEPVLFADMAVPVGGYRYELETHEGGARAVYVWAPDERPPFDHEAVFHNGPADGYSLHMIGLVEPQPHFRLAPGATPAFEWLHLPWSDTPSLPGEALYELEGTVIPPRGRGEPQAHYRYTEKLPWGTLRRA